MRRRNAPRSGATQASTRPGVPLEPNTFSGRRARIRPAACGSRRTTGCTCVARCVAFLVLPTNLALDDRLVAEAKRLGRHKSKRAAVNEALEEYVARRRQRRILDLFGRLEWDDDYDKGR